MRHTLLVLALALACDPGAVDGRYGLRAIAEQKLPVAFYTDSLATAYVVGGRIDLHRDSTFTDWALTAMVYRTGPIRYQADSALGTYAIVGDSIVFSAGSGYRYAGTFALHQMATSWNGERWEYRR